MSTVATLSGRAAIRALLIAALACFTAEALAQQVTVITSFPKELVEAYKKAFEAMGTASLLEPRRICK